MTTYRIEAPDRSLSGLELEDDATEPTIIRVLWGVAVRAHRLDRTHGMRYGAYAREQLHASSKEDR